MQNAHDLLEEGVKLYDQHDYEAAARTFQQAKDLFSELGQPDMVAEMKVNIGLVHRALGENQQALDLMREALKTFEESGDRLRTAQVLGNLGGVYAALNDKEQAYAAYRQAADIFLEQDEKAMYSDTLIALGRLQIRDGKILSGTALYQVGLEFKEHLTPTQKIIKRLSTVINSLSRR